MSFELSLRSLDRLNGVDDSLVVVVKRAIQLTEVDFGVSEGLRSIDRQKELVAKGASKTMKSKHIDGLAVDLVAYIDGRVSWELNLYDNIADAMAAAAKEYGVTIRWGGAWHIDDIGTWEGKMEDAMTTYIDLRRSQGKRPFIDGPHFELM
jgi:peptidoglycan L-alanyl-D-glutamate endopeptidase CwlK